MLPHERSLVKRFEGKPFAMIGVNSDEDFEEVVKRSKKEGVTWPSFKDKPDKDRPAVSDVWRVSAWPSVFLIDHKGVIRHKWLGPPDEIVLDKMVEDLVREAEKK
jgi:hypothetical protein